MTGGFWARPRLAIVLHILPGEDNLGKIVTYCIEPWTAVTVMSSTQPDFPEPERGPRCCPLLTPP